MHHIETKANILSVLRGGHGTSGNLWLVEYNDQNGTFRNVFASPQMASILALECIERENPTFDLLLDRGVIVTFSEPGQMPANLAQTTGGN